jgi:hypothetical protein
LLVDHRDDLVDERRRIHQRLRWHLNQLDPTFVVPLLMLARASHLEERVSRGPAHQEQELQVRLARELVSRCRALNRAILELDQELVKRVATAEATANSTSRSTGSRSPRPAITPSRAPTSNARRRKARAH